MANAGLGLSPDQMNLLLTGLGGAAGGFPSVSSTNGTASSTSSGTTNSSSSQNLQSFLNTLANISGKSTSNGTSTGQVTGGFADPGTAALSQKMAAAFSGLVNPNLSGYQSQGIESINHNSQITDKAQQEALAARGLSTSPIAGAVAAGEQANRVGQINNFQQGIPLLKNQLALANLNAGNGFLATAPKTSTTSGTTSETGTSQQTSESNQMGTSSGATNTGTTTNQSGSTIQNSNDKKGGGLGGIFGGLGAVLATLFG